ncbi:MBL fold metallo-hydrolase [Erysipelotrichaceae bacterium RD49]|nr:MBL fold metallo-hydrolase [Erysipelotrichaceae bacterium RD49]
MRVDLFCSGSKGNSCLVRTSSTSILIDCGPTTKRYMKNALESAGLTPQTLDALLITHSHGDHIRQLSMFTEIPVYTCCPLKAKDSRGHLVHLDLHTVARPSRFTIGDLKILAIATSHDSGPSMGFVIDDGYEKLVYVTDTGYLPAEVYPVLTGADYYIFESNHDLEMLQQTNRPFWLKQRICSDTGHMNNMDSARLLARFITARTRRIVLAHLSEEANTPKLALAALDARLSAIGFDRSHLTIQAAEQWQPLHFGQMHEKQESKAKAETALQSADDCNPSQPSSVLASGISSGTAFLAGQTEASMPASNSSDSESSNMDTPAKEAVHSDFAFDSSPDQIPEEDFDFELPEIPRGMFPADASKFSDHH